METFRRFEKKYLLDKDQYENLMGKLADHVKADKFFQSEICSIYYDTDDHRLIRRSLEKPEYKEKLRIRSYGRAKGDQKVFVELKKKFDGVVYKRRTEAPCDDALKDIRSCSFKDPQVGKEILYALNYYQKLKPSIFVGCRRTSYTGIKEEDLRITFDQDIAYRCEDLSLEREKQDKPVTDKIVMELKVKDAMPLWLSGILDEVGVYPQGFSKVGNAYLKELRGV